MTTDLLDAILTKAKSEFKIDWLSVYNWTEPLLHPRLPELIEVIDGHGIPSSISSNLNVKESYDFERLLATKPSLMRVSLSGFTQAVYERGHAGGDIELVKRNLRSLARARDKTHVKLPTFQVFFHVYSYNVSEIALMRSFCKDLGFPFSIGYAQILPVEKILDVMQGKVSEADQDLLVNLALPLDKALSITSKIKKKSCQLLDRTITINVAGDVMLCCGSSMDRGNTIGPFLELSLDELEARKSRHQLCGPCLNLGIPDYLFSHPSLTQAFDLLQEPALYSGRTSRWRNRAVRSLRRLWWHTPLPLRRIVAHAIGRMP